MATITIEGRTVEVPDLEVLAAFRQSYLTAAREGFPRKAFEVLTYLKALEGRD